MCYEEDGFRLVLGKENNYGTIYIFIYLKPNQHHIVRIRNESDTDVILSDSILRKTLVYFCIILLQPTLGQDAL